MQCQHSAIATLPRIPPPIRGPESGAFAYPNAITTGNRAPETPFEPRLRNRNLPPVGSQSKPGPQPAPNRPGRQADPRHHANAARRIRPRGVRGARGMVHGPVQRFRRSDGVLHGPMVHAWSICRSSVSAGQRPWSTWSTWSTGEECTRVFGARGHPQLL